MHFSTEILAGISLACVGVAGIAYLFSKRKDTNSDDCAELQKVEEDLEDDTENVFVDAETKVDKQGDIMQHDLEMCKMRCIALEHTMADAHYTIRKTLDEQLSDMKTKVNRLIETVRLMQQTAETTSAERMTEEKADGCNFDPCLNTRVRILEKEIIKMKIYPRALSSTDRDGGLESGEGAAAAAVTSAASESYERTLNLPKTQGREPSTSPTPTGRPPLPRPRVPRPSYI